MLVAVPPMGFALVLMPFMPNLWTTVLVVMTFFFAYYIYHPVPGAVPGRTAGGCVRALAGGSAHPARDRDRVALVGSGLLFKAWKPSPFLLASILTTTACALVILLVREDGATGGSSKVSRPTCGGAGRSSGRTAMCGGS